MVKGNSFGLVRKISSGLKKVRVNEKNREDIMAADKIILSKTNRLFEESFQP